MDRSTRGRGRGGASTGNALSSKKNRPTSNTTQGISQVFYILFFNILYI